MFNSSNGNELETYTHGKTGTAGLLRGTVSESERWKELTPFITHANSEEETAGYFAAIFSFLPCF